MQRNLVWHLLFLSTILVLSGVMFQCSDKESENSTSIYPPRIGDIEEDPSLDDANFQPCNEDWIQQHYSFRNLYDGGKSAIENAFSDINIQAKWPKAKGYITIRFLVNCRQETGRFRVQEMNFNYQPTTFPKALVQQLLRTTKELDKWQPANHKKRSYDYYHYLTFKIAAGKIVEILP